METKVKFLDLKNQYDSIKEEIDFVISDVIENSSFIGGKYLKQFENDFAKFLGVNYCIGVGNGTDALEIAIESLNLPKGSEIIVPANSFIASSEAVTRMDYKVKFCKFDLDDYTIDINDLRSKINSNTSAIICVHLYGMPCDMNPLIELCKDHKLKLIEDCAQAHGAEYNNKKIGTFGDVACFSFYPGKNLGAYGDAGAIVTDDDLLAKNAKMIANHGRIEKYNHEFEGRNSRMDGLQAAILSVKLKHLDSWTDKRIKVAKKYIQELKNILKLQKTYNNRKSVYHLFVVKTEKRDELKKYLINEGIQVGIHYPVLLPNLNAYSYLDNNDFKNNSHCEKLLSLPMGEHLTEKEIDLVINKIKTFFEDNK
jgi:dTDP-4-amino-4,6-dideoxygalactose transaminase